MTRAAFFPEGAEIIGDDETVLWRGRPAVSALAGRLFHTRAVALYFAAVAVVDVASAYLQNLGPTEALLATGWLIVAALGLMALSYAAAWCLAITTRYMLTDRRVILQIGVALPIALTLPLTKIASADLRLYPDGSGDIPLELDGAKLAYLLIWPHARPWCFAAPQPMLRAVPAAATAAGILAKALATASPSGEVRAIAIPSAIDVPPLAPALVEA